MSLVEKTGGLLCPTSVPEQGDVAALLSVVQVERNSAVYRRLANGLFKLGKNMLIAGCEPGESRPMQQEKGSVFGVATWDATLEEESSLPFMTRTYFPDGPEPRKQTTMFYVEDGPYPDTFTAWKVRYQSAADGPKIVSQWPMFRRASTALLDRVISFSEHLEAGKLSESYRSLPRQSGEAGTAPATLT